MRRQRYLPWPPLPTILWSSITVTPREMLRELMNDNKKVAAAMRKAHKICDDAEDVASASILENFIDETERRTWFLFEATRQEGGNEA